MANECLQPLKLEEAKGRGSPRVTEGERPSQHLGLDPVMLILGSVI